MKPVYKHDCEECIFLGNYNFKDEVYDLYFCNKPTKTVIARYGNYGFEYLSGLVFANEKCMPLLEAKKRAELKKLLD